MLRLAGASVLATLALVTVSPAAAGTQLSCFADAREAAGSLRIGKVTDIPTLTREQKLEIQSRLLTETPATALRLDFTDLGISAADIAEIKRRIALDVPVTRPVGYPCKPFKSPAKVVTFVRTKLLDNGFRPRPMPFTVSPRRIEFTAIQDGIQYQGAVVRSGPRKVTIKLVSYQPKAGVNHLVDVGGVFPFTTPFEP